MIRYKVTDYIKENIIFVLTSIFFSALFILKSNHVIIGFLISCVVLGVIIYMTLLLNKKEIPLYNLIIMELLVIISVLFWNLYIFYKGIIFSPFSLVIEVLGIGILYFALISILFEIINNLKKVNRSQVVRFLKGNIGIILVCILFVIGCLPQIDVWLGNDGTIYQWGVVNARENWNFFNVEYLNLGGHGGYSYCLFALLGDLLFKDSTRGIIFVNILMGVATIVAFYIIVEKICVKVPKMERVLFTLLFAVSPFLYGLIGDINLEFPQLCFLTWLIASCLCQNKWMKRLSGLLLCFTKETSGAIYAFFCLGEFLYYCYKEKDKKLIHRVFFVLKSKMGFEIALGILWVYSQVFYNSTTMLTKAVSSSDKIDGIYLNKFSVWWGYIVFKFKEIFIFNNNWIIWCLCGGILIFSFRKLLKNCKHIQKNTMLGIITSFAMFMFTQLFYITWTNYRYISPMAIYQAIITMFILYYGINKQKIRTIILSSLILITFLSNYYMIDGVSKLLFAERNMGNGSAYIMNYFSLDCLKEQEDGSVIITRIMDDEKDAYCGLRDVLVYNRQYSYIGKIFNEIMIDINYDENTLIVLPNISYDIEKTCSSTLYRDAYILNLLYWNDNMKCFNTNVHRDPTVDYSKGYKKVNIKVCDDINEIRNIANQYENIYCVYPNMNQTYDIYSFFGKNKVEILHSYTKNMFKIDLYDITGICKTE